MPGKRQPLAPRFWKKVEKTDGCWNWTAAKNSSGYGWVGVDGGRRSVHRVSWEMHAGPIPEGLHVLHKCDNRLCVRPDHLFLGTNADNIADKIAKGRQSRVRQCGESHPQCRISDAAVDQIRARLAQGLSQRKIAEEFGIAQQTVSKIYLRKSRTEHGVVFGAGEALEAMAR